MGSILKNLFFILLGLIILVIALPLLWLVVQEFSGLFGVSAPAGSDFFYFLFTIICIIAIVWMLATWD